MTELSPRSPRVSYTHMTELVLPQHANRLGTAFGGSVMAWIDICGAIVAQRHSGTIAVTAAVDELVFLAPIRIGDVVELHGRINGAFSSSMEVGVKVSVQEPAGAPSRLCVEALLTFVSIDEQGKPKKVPPIDPETDEDRKLAHEAAGRRAERLSRKR